MPINEEGMSVKVCQDTTASSADGGTPLDTDTHVNKNLLLKNCATPNTLVW